MVALGVRGNNMALLTEEQINDLRETIVNEDGTILDSIIEWNEKQTTQQIEPDWSKASDNAVSAVVNVTWVDKLGTWLGSHPVVIFERPVSVITPHPHAEIMAKYAEVAARRVDPWVEFEYKAISGDIWEELTSNPSWHTIREYRHIGDNK